MPLVPWAAVGRSDRGAGKEGQLSLQHRVRLIGAGEIIACVTARVEALSGLPIRPDLAALCEDHPTPRDVVDTFSMIFWVLTFVVGFKYVTVVLSVSHHGEGGAFAMLHNIFEQALGARRWSVAGAFRRRSSGGSPADGPSSWPRGRRMCVWALARVERRDTGAGCRAGRVCAGGWCRPSIGPAVRARCGERSATSACPLA